MTLKQYLTIMVLASILCWTAWVVVIMNVDPFEANAISFLFFYVSLFFALLGTVSLIIFALYHFFSKEEQPLFRYVQRSFRDAFFLSVLTLGLLMLQAWSMLNMWSGGFFVLSVLFFISFKMSPQHRMPRAE